MAQIKHEIDNSAAIQAEQRYQREKEKSRKALEDEIKNSKIADRETQNFLKRAQTEQQKWTRAQAQAQELKKREPRLTKEIEASLERQRRSIFKVDQAEKMRAQAAAESTKQEKAARRKAIEEAERQRAAQEKLLAQGRRIKQDLETPTERYNRRLKELGRLYRKGAIDQQTFVRGSRKLKAELREVGDTGKQTFGDQALSRIRGAGGMAGAIGIATGAATLLAREIQNIEERAQAATDRVNASLRGLGELTQISNTPKDFRANVKLVDRLVAEGIVKPEEREQGANIAFDLKSAEKVNRDLIIELGKQKVVRPEQLGETAKSVNVVLSSVGSEAGSTRDILNKAIATAAPLPGATFTDVTNAVAEIGTQINTLGFRDEAAFAAVGVLGEKFRSVDRAKTRIESFLSEVDKRELSAGSLVGTVEAIDRRVQGGEKLQDIIGDSKEAVAGFRGLRDDLPKLKAEFIRIDQAQRDDPLATKLSLVDSNDRTRLSKLKAIKQGKLDVEVTDRSDTRENLLDAAIADAKANNLKRLSPLAASIANTDLALSSGIADGLQIERSFLRGHLGGAGFSLLDLLGPGGQTLKSVTRPQFDGDIQREILTGGQQQQQQTNELLAEQNELIAQQVDLLKQQTTTTLVGQPVRGRRE